LEDSRNLLRLQAALARSSDAFCSLVPMPDAQGGIGDFQIAYCNPAFAHLWRSSGNAQAGALLSAVLPAALARTLVQQYAQVLLTGEALFEERERLVEDMGTKNAMILRNHGTLTVGETVAQCFLRLYFLERACEAQVKMLSAGRDGLYNPPQGTPEKVEQQSNGPGMSMTADRLAWPALLRKLDRIDPSFRN
jgi:PAS domain-containing protein